MIVTNDQFPDTHPNHVLKVKTPLRQAVTMLRHQGVLSLFDSVDDILEHRVPDVRCFDNVTYVIVHVKGVSYAFNVI